MSLTLFGNLKQSAGHLACRSFLYDWTLGGDVPDRLVIRPVDPWPGNPEAGEWLCNGNFVIEDEQLELRGKCWEPLGIEKSWFDHMHGFTWLRDLRATGGERARRQAQNLVAGWIDRYPKWQEKSWRSDLLGTRIAMWITHYDMFGEASDDDFHDSFFESLIRQSRHLARSMPNGCQGVAALTALRGLLYAGLAFQGRECWIDQALDLLKIETRKQILDDGGHVTRSPAQLMKALQVLLELRSALGAAGLPLPDFIQHAIDRAAPALRFFRTADKHLTLFHGSQEGESALIDCVLAQTGIRGKAMNSLPFTGFERTSMGRTHIYMDTGGAPPPPYDGFYHAAPLSFEMGYGKERVIIACGTHPISDEWRESLRATAAHNTLAIDNRDACEIAPGHISRKARVRAVHRDETKEACLIEAAHDGYMTLNGITHRRRLYLGQQGNDVRGEDTLTCTIGLAKSHDVTLRFHIHPRVMVSLIRDGEEALLRLPSGIGWRFCHNAGTLSIENSLYLGHGTRPRKTKQLVVSARMEASPHQIKWALRREGA